jgi:beta-galactosidase
MKKQLIHAVDNGNILSHEAYQANERKAFQGNCIAIVKATAPTGTITFKASMAGLPDASITLQVTK